MVQCDGKSYVPLKHSTSVKEKQGERMESEESRFSSEPLLGLDRGQLHIYGQDRGLLELVDSIQPDDVSMHNAKMEPRERIEKILYSFNFQFGVMVLVFIDLALVVFEVVIEMQYYKSHYIEQNHTEFTKVAEFVHSSRDNHIFHYMSTALACLFIIEMALKLYILRWNYFRKGFELFDGVVVICSLATDIHFIESIDPIADLIGLVILLRFLGVAIHIEDISAAIKRKSLKLKEIEIAQLEKKYSYLLGFVKQHGVIVESKNNVDIVIANPKQLQAANS